MLTGALARGPGSFAQWLPPCTGAPARRYSRRPGAAGSPPALGREERDRRLALRLAVRATTSRLHRYTFEEYLTLEESSSVRHEFLAGEIYALAGGSPAHAVLAMAVGAALIALLRGAAAPVYGRGFAAAAASHGPC